MKQMIDKSLKAGRTGLLGVFVWAALSAPVNAASGGGVNIENLLQSLIDLLTGNIARLVAVLAVIFLGYRAFTGRLDAGLAVGIGVAIFLVFGGAWIVDQVLV